jgi:hypothetical protein
MEQPDLPSSFVAAVLRLCFPTQSIDSVDTLAVSSKKAVARRHPAMLVAYLLQRKVVGEGFLPGGLVARLAQAGDWVRFPILHFVPAMRSVNLYR